MKAYQKCLLAVGVLLGSLFAWHDVGIVRAESEPLPHTIQLLRAATRLYNQGHLDEAEQTLQQALDEAKRSTVPGEEFFVSALATGSLGQIYSDRGHYDQAETFIKRSIDMQEKFSGPDDSGIMSAYNNLGMLYRITGRYAEAESCYKRILPVLEKDPDEAYAKALNNYAEVLRYENKLDEAEVFYKKAIEVHKQTGNDIRTSIPLANIGDIYLAKNQPAAAVPYYEQALAFQKKGFPENSPYIATTVSSLGTALSQQGKYDLAEPLLKQSVAIHKANFGNNHLSVALALNNLGIMYILSHRLAMAEPILKEALASCQASLAVENPTCQKIETSVRDVQAYHSRLSPSSRNK